MKRPLSIAVLALLTCLSLSALAASPDVPAGAFASAAVEQGDPRVEVRLISDVSSVQPGEPFRVGALFDMDPEWHIYWKNSGESGLSTEVTPGGDPALSYSEIMWPAPEIWLDPSGEIATFGYGDQALLFFDVSLEPAFAHPEVSVHLEADFLACKVDCIPGNVEISRTLNVGPLERSSEAEYFDSYSRAQALAPEHDSLSAEFATQKTVYRGDDVQGRWTITCESDACTSLEVVSKLDRYAFIPDADQSVAWQTTSTRSTGSSTVLELNGRANPDELAPPCSIGGVVYLSVNGETPRPFSLASSFECVDAPAPQPSGEDASRHDLATDRITDSPVPDQPQLPLWQILIFALLGGMLLNLMPCVFPVLAIKVFALVNHAHEDRRSVYGHSSAYTAGIVASMIALAAVVIGLKEIGHHVGWGFQFQEPLFVAALAGVLVAFALNLFGVFEINTPAAAGQARTPSSGLRRSFGEGILAVVLATPCSAPFLGTAVGFALGSKAWVIVLVFSCLGLGLALPFVVLTLSPAWARLLPKPGDWMVVFKEFLGFALLGTVVWLVWILGQSGGNDAVVRLLAFLVAVAVAAWIWGRVQFTGSSKRLVGGLLALSLVTAAGYITLDFNEPNQRSPESRSVDADEMWQPWSDEAVDQAQKAGHTVFVDFTADWCITCKVNENGPLATQEVLSRLASDEVVALKADWTRRDDTIRAALAKHGKGGVPLYLVYPPHSGAPEILPELLTESRILTALDNALTR